MIKIRKNILLIFVVSLVLFTGLAMVSDFNSLKNKTLQVSDQQCADEAPDCFSADVDVSVDEQLTQITISYALVENTIIIVNPEISGIVAQTRLRHWQPPKK
jgi:hypothetical protein